MQPYFTDISAQIKSKIFSTEKLIKIAVSWFTNKELLDALIQRLGDNVEVQLIIINDTLNIRVDGLDFQNFINKGGKLFLMDSTKLMHNKYCILDNKELFTGSYNWTYSAENRNLENVLYSNDVSIVAEYLINFDTIKLEANHIKDMGLSNPVNSVYTSNEILDTEKKLSSYTIIKTIPSRIYKAADFQPANEWGKFKKYVTALDVSNDGKLLAAAGGNWLLQIWDIETGILYYSFEISTKNTGSYPSEINFSPNSNFITMNDGYKGIITLSVFDKKLLYHKHYQENAGEVKYSLSGEQIAICSNHQVFISEAKTGDIIEIIKTPFKFSRALEFMNNDTQILIASQDEGLPSHIKLYSINDGMEVIDFTNTEKGIKALKKVDEFNFIATGWSNDFFLWNINKSLPIRKFTGHNNYVFDCDVNTESMFVVTGSLDLTVKLWDINTGKQINSFDGHHFGVHSVKFDSKHSVIFSSDEGGKIITNTY